MVHLSPARLSGVQPSSSLVIVDGRAGVHNLLVSVEVVAATHNMVAQKQTECGESVETVPLAQ